MELFPILAATAFTGTLATLLLAVAAYALACDRARTSRRFDEALPPLPAAPPAPVPPAPPFRLSELRPSPAA